MNNGWILQLPILMFSVVLHEYMHGFIAKRRGDNTAEYMGRLTFNPLPHIDPVGTIIFPMICYFANFPMIGWAKPVPVNPLNFNNLRRDTIAVSLAGPFSNFALMIVFTILLKLSFMGNSSASLWQLFSYGLSINLVLGIFNLIPLYPLDGSKVVYNLLPSGPAETYAKHFPYGFFILIGLYITGLLKYVLILPYTIIGSAVSAILALPVKF